MCMKDLCASNSLLNRTWILCARRELIYSREWDVGRLFEPSRRGCDHDVHMLVGYKVVREGGGKDAEQRPMLPMRINHSLVAYVPNHDLRRAIVEASRTVTMLE